MKNVLLKGILTSWILFTPFLSHAANENDYPNRPIKFIVPFPAGGALDVAARAISDPLSQNLKQPIIIENRLGAGARVGTEVVANAPGDGYTVLIATPSSTTMAPLLISNLSYSPNKDLLPVMKVAEIVNVMVVPASRDIHTVEEFLKWAKSQARSIKYGSSGIGSADHLVAEFFQQKTGLPLTHVPYKGGGPAMIDLASTDIDVSFTTYAAASALVSAGKIRPIAVLTDKRQPFLPNLPAINETIPGLSISNWAGVFVPKNTPQAVRERLFKELTTVSQFPDTRIKENKSGLEVNLSSSIADFENELKSQQALWATIIKNAKIKVE